MLVQDCAGDGSLADRLAVAGQAGLRPERTAAVGAAFARAPAHAHRHGLVHRDVKPSNVLFTGARARLTDFSLFGELLDDAQLTRAGVVVGSLAYMSPEQFAGVPQAAASDVFGLGVLLFECLHGRTPFAAGGTLADQLSARLGGGRRDPAVATGRPARALPRRGPRAPPARRRGGDRPRRAAAPEPGRRRDDPDVADSPARVRSPATPGAAVATSPGGVLAAAVLVLATLGAVVAFRKLTGPAAGEDDIGLLARMEQGEDLTRSMLVQVDELVARLAAPEARFLGLSVMATIRDYDRADDFGRRAELLQQAVATMQQLVRELAPWCVRHKEAITLVIAVVGAATAVATAVAGFLRP